ncbi:MAG: HD domain-containing protein [Myxococcales bacterium]|nr:HD domain-containing protein [Myxococcales bacterium]
MAISTLLALPVAAMPGSTGARVRRTFTGRRQLVVGRRKMPLSKAAAKVLDGALREPDLQRRLVKALQALRAHDQHAFEHSRRVGAYARLLARALGYGAEAPMVGLAGALHDIGKLGVSQKLLSGKSDKLGKRQLREIRRHPGYGATLLSALGADLRSVRGALTHHERLDGAGYPLGLSGAGVPAVARILGVVDAFDAMTSQRSYNKPMSKAQAVARLRELSGTSLDARCVEAFIEVLDTSSGRAVFAASQRHPGGSEH